MGSHRTWGRSPAVESSKIISVPRLEPRRCGVAKNNGGCFLHTAWGPPKLPRPQGQDDGRQGHQERQACGAQCVGGAVPVHNYRESSELLTEICRTGTVCSRWMQCLSSLREMIRTDAKQKRQAQKQEEKELGLLVSCHTYAEASASQASKQASK